MFLINIVFSSVVQERLEAMFYLMKILELKIYQLALVFVFYNEDRR